MASKTNITSLPWELIQKIASFSRLNDVSALSRTCRVLHTICSDESVLRESLINTIRDAASGDVPDSFTLRKTLAARINSKAAWARLALAIPQVSSLIADLERSLRPYDSDLWKWYGKNIELEPLHREPRPVQNVIGMLGTLAVLGYPTIYGFTVKAALAGLATRFFDPRFWNPTPEEADEPVVPYGFAPQLAFCLATGALETRVLNGMPTLLDRLESFLNSSNDGASLPPSFAESFAGTQTVGLLVIAVMPCVLYSDPFVRSRGHLPHPAALPFLNVAGRGDCIPLPDGDAWMPENGQVETSRRLAGCAMSPFGLAPSWSQWLRNNVDVLIDDIGRGEWVGYYTTLFGAGEEVDEPLRNIHFNSLPDPDDPDCVLLEADNCTYGWGTFGFRGSVHRPTGRVKLVKAGEAEDMWHIEGTLTPLGIAGTWGGTIQREIGLMWMYKKEWAQKPVSDGASRSWGPEEPYVGPSTASSLHFSI